MRDDGTEDCSVAVIVGGDDFSDDGKMEAPDTFDGACEAVDGFPDIPSDGAFVGAAVEGITESREGEDDDADPALVGAWDRFADGEIDMIPL